MEKIKLQGLVRGSGYVFFIWGVIVGCRGLFDAFFGEPEANLYAPKKWEFVTYHQWMSWAGFEIAYGAACVGLAVVLWKYARFLPENVLRHTAAPHKGLLS